MKISIITVTYNNTDTIANCVASVYNQTHEDIEHIIVDGASSDNTLKIIKANPSRVAEIISEPDNGIYDAMNKGIRLATGDIIGILNSDDYYADNRIIKKIVTIFENEKVDSVFGNLEFVDQHDTNKGIRVWKSSKFKPGSFKKGWHPSHPTFFVKKEVYEKYGLFDASFDVSADFELMLRFIEKYKISTYYLDETIVKMRYGGESTGSLKRIFIGNKNVLRAFKKNGIKVPPLYRLLPKLKRFVIR